ncbi:hypothetical protein H0N95_02755, partial [Candidatus Micrarchaeota archaeon]|nr:hypothetical protein [Candidatus Micrarchaeota archaeon]
MAEDMKLSQVTKAKATAETRESDIWRRKIADMNKKNYIDKSEAMEDLVKIRKALNKSASQKPTNIESGKDKQRYEQQLKSAEEHISSELKQKFGIKKVEVIPFGFTEAEEKILYE